MAKASAKVSPKATTGTSVQPLVNQTLCNILNAEERQEAIRLKIDRFGSLKAAITPLEAEASKIGDELKGTLTEGTTAGHEFEVLVTDTTPRVVNNKKLIKKIGQDKFNTLATVSLKALAEVMGAVDIDQVTEDQMGEDGKPKKTRSIRPKAIKQVKM